jgi:putative hydrolase
VIRNDLHVHSIRSSCGLHTLLEIVSIASAKGVRSLNLSDHGPALGRSINFGVFTDLRRLPETVKWGAAKVRVWRGIEANLLNIAGDTDVPPKFVHRFDIISLGLHACFELAGLRDEARNTKAFVNAFTRRGVDLATHPCIKAHPVNIDAVVEAAAETGVMLEINNTNLRLGKTDVRKLERMIAKALDCGALLVESSDGHVYTEIGENEQVETLLSRMGLDPDATLFNRRDKALDAYITKRKQDRTP